MLRGRLAHDAARSDSEPGLIGEVAAWLGPLGNRGYHSIAQIAGSSQSVWPHVFSLLTGSTQQGSIAAGGAEFVIVCCPPLV